MEPEQWVSADKAPWSTQASSLGAPVHQPRSRAWIESALTDRLHASAHPSRMLNQLYDAQARCAAHAHLLQQAVVYSPRISRLIRQTLREAFQTDPDALLLNVPMTRDDPRWRRSLTDTVMRLLAERECAKAGHLSEQACQAGAIADKVLSEVLDDVDLLARIKASVLAYWQVLAESDVCSRRDRWSALYKTYVADQALLAYGLNQLSDSGLAMLMTLVEAPTAEARTQAGGVRAGLRVAEVVCPGQGDSLIPFSGALHLFYADEKVDTRQVLFLPGLDPVFYEFSTYEQWQRHFPALVQTHVQRLWALLPLRKRHQLPDSDAVSLLPLDVGRRGSLIAEDALAHSAEALLQVQWDNELATLLEVNIAFLFPGNAIKGVYMSPAKRLLHVEQGRGVVSVQPALKPALAQLLERDKQRRRLEISFASLSTSLPLRTCEAKVHRYEQALQRLLDPADPGRESQDFGIIVSLHTQWQEARARCAALLDGQEERLDDPAFWIDTGTDQQSVEQRLLAAHGSALIAEAQLHHRLKLIDAPSLARISAVVDKPLRARSAGQGRVLTLSVGGQSQPKYRLLGAFVVAGAASPADDSANHAVLLYVPGSSGGLQRFKSLAFLSRCVQASFTAREPGVLWQCIARGERNAARAWAQGLGADSVVVSFEAIDGDVLKTGLQTQITAFTEARQQLQRNEQLYSEVSDRALAATFLAMETVQNLQVPPNDAWERALSNTELVMAAARLSAVLPGGADDASASVRKPFRRLLMRQQRSALNLQHRLVKCVGHVEGFGRQRLIQQLTQDGLYPELDIDTPLFDLPDDVSMVWATHPERLPGEAGPKTVVSEQRTTFSFLQLALHNLDPEAPWTRWRLNHMNVLEPSWKVRLSVDYLIRTIAILDIAGHYERKIVQVCYGEDGINATAQAAPLLHELLRRPVRRLAKMALMNARQRGLSEQGALLFEQALKAKRDAGPEHARLSFVRLEALTLPWARHIAGMVVIHDRETRRCLLYWPQSGESPALTEYPHLRALREALMAQLQAKNSITALAKSVAAGSEFHAIGSYPGGLKPVVEPESRWRCMLERSGLFTLSHVLGPGVAMSKCLYRWFKTKRVFPATALSEIEAEIHEQREYDPQQWLGITATNADDMLGLLAHACVLQVQRDARAESNSQQTLQAYREWRYEEASARTTRGLLSLIPLVGLGVKVYEVMLTARRVYHSGNANDVFELIVAVHQLLIEVALTFLPLKTGAIKPIAVSPVRFASAAFRQLHRGFRRQSKLSVRPPASPIKLKGLEPYKMPGTAVDAVALKAPLDKGTYIRNGEQFAPDSTGQRFGVYQRKGEQRLRFRSTQTPGENEIFVFVEEPRDWLLGADRLEPLPGPSSRAQAFWQPPQTPLQASWSPPLHSQRLVEGLAMRPHKISSVWREWGRVLDGGQVRELVPGKGLYIADGTSGTIVKVGERFYDTLAIGSQAHSDLVFIKPSGDLMGSIDDLSMRLSENPVQQPVLFTFNKDLGWTAREPLFSQPLPTSLRSRFPDLTPTSVQQLTRRLVELADSGTSVTSTRLLNIRATLNKWAPRPYGVMAQTDDLLTMLRPMSPRKARTLYMGVDTEVGGFERLDFYLPAALDAKLFSKQKGDKAVTQARVVASTEAVSNILRRQGFAIKQVPVPYFPQYYHLICTHTASNKLYFVVIKWVDGKSLVMKTGRERVLSREWLIDKSALHPALYQTSLVAQNEGRLVKVFAGIQNVDPPTVYFIRPADLS